MPSHDRFLRSRPSLQGGASALGRVFSVVQETWQVSDDPKKVKPLESVLATRRTASDAADLARAAATAYERHGFHKPSGAWWGSDRQDFHRFVVAARRDRAPGGPAFLLGLGFAALAATAFGVAARARRRQG